MARSNELLLLLLTPFVTEEEGLSTLNDVRGSGWVHQQQEVTDVDDVVNDDVMLNDNAEELKHGVSDRTRHRLATVLHSLLM